MKKVLFLASALFISGVANAQTEYYTSIKAGLGDTTIYVQGDTKLGDYLSDVAGAGYRYDGSGLTWELSPAIGIDWSPNSLYVKQNPYGWFHLRLEGEFGYIHYHEDGKLKDKNYTITDKTKLKIDQFVLLANGYADFKIRKVVPYVGFGLGYSFGKEEITVSNSAGEFGDSANDNGIVYALHFGVAYKYSEITTLDLGYRRVYEPTEDDGLNVFGTIRFGARFRI